MNAPSSTWTSDELDTIDCTGEVDIATRRNDGVDAAWYRGVQTRHEGELTAGRLHREVVFVEAGSHAGDGDGLDAALDVAYRDKYGRGSAVTHITAALAHATTRRVDPA